MKGFSFKWAVNRVSLFSVHFSVQRCVFGALLENNATMPQFGPIWTYFHATSHFNIVNCNSFGGIAIPLGINSFQGIDSPM